MLLMNDETSAQLSATVHTQLCNYIHLRITHTQHTHTRLTALFRDYPGEPVPEGKTNLDFTEAIDSEWQWHQLGHMQVCTSLQADNHASTPSPSFLQAGCPSGH